MLPVGGLVSGNAADLSNTGPGKRSCLSSNQRLNGCNRLDAVGGEGLSLRDRACACGAAPVEQGSSSTSPRNKKIGALVGPYIFWLGERDCRFATGHAPAALRPSNRAPHPHLPETKK